MAWDANADVAMQHHQEAIEFLKMCGNIKQALVIEKQLGIVSAPDTAENRPSTRSSDISAVPLQASPSGSGLSAASTQLLEDALQLLDVSVDHPRWCIEGGMPAVVRSP